MKRLLIALAVGLFTVSAFAACPFSKDEWRTKVASLQQNPNELLGAGIIAQMPKAALIAAVGKPDRTQRIEGQQFWYWDCTDGMIQIVGSSYTDFVGREFINGKVNDY
jgi:hypothetical protein